MKTSVGNDTTVSVTITAVGVMNVDVERTNIEVHVMSAGKRGHIVFEDKGISFMDFMIRKLGQTMSVPVGEIVWHTKEDDGHG
jgi:hypothetical protein